MRAVRPSFVLASMSTCVARLLAQSFSDLHAAMNEITKLRPECHDGYLTGQVTGYLVRQWPTSQRQGDRVGVL